MIFSREADFEQELIHTLFHKGWEEKVLKNPTEQDLLDNWATILFQNNRTIDRLNDYPLTNGEMNQIIEKITSLRTPLKLNGFINGKTVSIVRDNPNDTLHFGKEIDLKIYDRQEIAAGQSRYQIAQQPKFTTKSNILNNRRGDVMLLINGMPVIHIELKKSSTSVSQAYHQIEKYAYEGVFTGLFSLVQVFVAMEPDKTVYFANPGPDGKFNKDYYFQWADFNNEPIHNWQDIVSSLLSIPMAHQLIGFYTVADNADGTLKVMRSYQYQAANAISDKVSKHDWKSQNQRGGFIWHTTGSGKTMTSFKSAQLIANSKDADKVVFLIDRIELGTQSLEAYQGFAEADEWVQATENTHVLITKLKSPKPADTLIVTSIQKMSNIKDEDNGLYSHDIALMNSKRIVFIVDEAHRSTFGEMLKTIKEAFPRALFFGFTGTPIQNENKRKDSTTSDIFGNELHRYSIADGIRDKNVLGFDPYKVLTYKDKDLRRAVALEKARAKTEEEAIKDPVKSKIYYTYMDSSKVKMADFTDKNGNIVKGVESMISKAQYTCEEHQRTVVHDIVENWTRLSHNGKFHALFATSSIYEAIQYYRQIKESQPALKITALFDPNIDNNEGFQFKEDGLVEIISDYNNRYEQNFTIATHGAFKKDISNRLAHKDPYIRIETTTEKQIDILIVVDQMLTGFDSKWLNTLYLDKKITYEYIIQAFSRTNRLFGPEKPFGTIRYYRYPHTMEKNIGEAVKSYSGDRPLQLFVSRLHENLEAINTTYQKISTLFRKAYIPNFEQLPGDASECGKFAQYFKELHEHLEAAQIQGFTWKNQTYTCDIHESNQKSTIEVELDETTYLTLAQRYKELHSSNNDDGQGRLSPIPYEIEGYLTEIDTDVIDTNYMNSRFEKFLKVLNQGHGSEQLLGKTLNELHKSFASLPQEEQKYANIFIHDVQRGEAKLQDGKNFRDYITEYQCKDQDTKIYRITETLGIDAQKLKDICSASCVMENINEYGRFDDLKATVDKNKAKNYFERQEGHEIPPYKVNIKAHELLIDFIVHGTLDIEDLE